MAHTSLRLLKTGKSLINSVTCETRAHLTPEICLKLITPDSPLWHQKVDVEEAHPLGEPFWAFYWPGGQCLARYILDCPGTVAGKRILDVGAGCGAVSIAAGISKAKHIIANDIDPLAMDAVKCNAELNGISSLTLDQSDLIGTPCEDVDVVLLGDMLYDAAFGNQVLSWVRLLKRSGKSVLVGDPGRDALRSATFQENLRCLAKYELDQQTKAENNGFSCASVFYVV